MEYRARGHLMRLLEKASDDMKKPAFERAMMGLTGRFLDGI